MNMNRSTPARRPLFRASLVLLLLAPGLCFAQEKPGLAVLDFATEGVEASVGRNVAERLLSYMGKTGRYSLVERFRMDEVLREQNLQSSDLVDDERQAAEAGKIAGARYVVVGTVIVDRHFGDIHIAARIIDVETAAIVDTDFIEGDSFQGLRDDLPRMAVRLGAGNVGESGLPEAAGAAAATHARTFVVGQGEKDAYSSIQAAIDAAGVGDLVYVKPGEYEENIKFKNGVVLRGAGASKCVIKSKQVVFWVNIFEARNCSSGSVENLTFDGLGKGVGVWMRDSSLSFKNCVFKKLATYGVKVVGTNSKPTLSGNKVLDNNYIGLYFSEGAKGLIEKNIVQNNGHDGILIEGKSTSPTIQENVCRANGRIGIYFRFGAAGLAERNTCENNASAGICVFGWDTAPIIRDNACSGNQENQLWYTGGASGETVP